MYLKHDWKVAYMFSAHFMPWSYTIFVISYPMTRWTATSFIAQSTFITFPTYSLHPFPHIQYIPSSPVLRNKHETKIIFAGWFITTTATSTASFLPSSTSLYPHPESRHLLVLCVGCSFLQQPVVGDAAGHSSDSKQHGYFFPLAKVLLLTCWAWSSARVNRYDQKNTTIHTIGCIYIPVLN